MPHDVEHTVPVEQVRKGDRFSTNQTTGGIPYGATIDEVKRGTKWVTLFGPELSEDVRERYAKLELGTMVGVLRVEPTEAEKDAQKAQWLEEHSRSMLEKMETSYPAAVASLQDYLAKGWVPQAHQVDAMYRGARYAQHAEHLRRGVEVHPDKSLRDLFLMLREQLVSGILNREVPASTSGGFSFGNAISQLNHEVDVRLVQSIDSYYLRGL